MMTEPSITLSELLEKGPDSDLLREMTQHVVQRVMDMDIENLCAAGYGERSPERQNSRNGYRRSQDCVALLWRAAVGVNCNEPRVVGAKRRINMHKQKQAIGLSLFFYAFGAFDVKADQETIVAPSIFAMDSAGIDDSGPIHVEGTQTEKAVTKLIITAFGKPYILTSAQLTNLGQESFNTVGLSYSAGYSNMGGRNVYILLGRGFSSGVKVKKVVWAQEKTGLKVIDQLPAQ